MSLYFVFFWLEGDSSTDSGQLLSGFRSTAGNNPCYQQGNSRHCFVFSFCCVYVHVSYDSNLVRSALDWSEKCWSRKSGSADSKGVWYFPWRMHQGKMENLNCWKYYCFFLFTCLRDISSFVDFCQISAKLGTNVEQILQAVVTRIPP